MTDVAPFRALRYDPTRVDLARVLVPPYDVITDEDRERYYQRDPHCAIRLELTRDPADEGRTDYADVAALLADWQAAAVLRRDPEPAFYVLRQRFRDPSGSAHERIGFFGALQIEEYEKRVVLPHERTMSGPKADRLKMLRATRANLSSVFMLYEDRAETLGPALAAAVASPAAITATDEAGIEQTLAPLTDAAAVETLRCFLAERAVVIADGHHRYETALAYRDEQRAAAANGTAEPGYDRMLAYFANAYSPGSLLLPIHRVVKKGAAPTEEAWRAALPGWSLERVEGASTASIAALLEEHLAPLAARHAFAADDGSGTLQIWSRPGGGALTVRRLHTEVIEGLFDLDQDAVRDGAVAFPKAATEAAGLVRGGAGVVALYLNPLHPDDVFRVTGAGEILPQKSTFFFPKLPSGLVFRPLEEGG